jgi:hypothetical protein
VRLKLRRISKNLPKLETKKTVVTPVAIQSTHLYDNEKQDREKQNNIDYNLTIDTKKAEYRQTDTITISGRVTIQQSKDKVRIKIIGPNGSENWTDQTEPESDGSYSFSKIVQEDLGASGQYRVIVEYGDIIEETTITLLQ